MTTITQTIKTTTMISKEDEIQRYYELRYVRNQLRDKYESVDFPKGIRIKEYIHEIDIMLTEFETYMSVNNIPNEYELHVPEISKSIVSVTLPDLNK